MKSVTIVTTHAFSVINSTCNERVIKCGHKIKTKIQMWLFIVINNPPLKQTHPHTNCGAIFVVFLIYASNYAHPESPSDPARAPDVFIVCGTA